MSKSGIIEWSKVTHSAGAHSDKDGPVKYSIVGQINVSLLKGLLYGWTDAWYYLNSANISSDGKFQFDNINPDCTQWAILLTTADYIPPGTPEPGYIRQLPDLGGGVYFIDKF